MKSATLPSFWENYNFLSENVKRKARKAYSLWERNPFHPSLHFKCINHTEGIWSVRIDLDHRAIGLLDGDTITWFWIGNHEDYESYFS
ncbi:MAG TPA: hypothetical protein VHY08_25515 [Bacillota bacterium]|nr:hypothetical protein [Bacillota bacterium]